VGIRQDLIQYQTQHTGTKNELSMLEDSKLAHHIGKGMCRELQKLFVDPTCTQW